MNDAWKTTTTTAIDPLLLVASMINVDDIIDDIMERIPLTCMEQVIGPAPYGKSAWSNEWLEWGAKFRAHVKVIQAKALIEAVEKARSVEGK